MSSPTSGGAPWRLLSTALRSQRAAPVALILGVSLTFVATGYVAETKRYELQDHFEHHATEAHDILTQHLAVNVEVLRGLQGLFVQAGERPVTRHEFRSYANHLNLERYPGIQALTFTRYLKGKQLATYEDSIRRDSTLNRPGFAVRPAGPRDDYYVADYISPENKENDFVFGLDLANEPVRRATFERARDTGLPAATNVIKLHAPGGDPKGFLVAAPVYRSGALLRTVEERRLAFLGCVTAVFRSDAMISGLLSRKVFEEVDIEIFEDAADGSGDKYDLEHLLFDSATYAAGHAVPLHGPDAALSLRKTDRLEVADRHWLVVYTGLPSSANLTSQAMLPAIVMGGGVVLSLLLAALIAFISRHNRRLESQVATRTEALKASNAELAESVEKLTISNRNLETAHNQLLQAEKMSLLGQLAAGVAHEINNPVGFINSNLGSLKNQVEDLLRVLAAYAEADALVAAAPEIRGRIDAAKHAADIEFIRDDIGALIGESLEGVQRVKKIVQDLKNFSRADGGEWHLTNIEKGIDSSLNIVRNEIKYKADVVKEYGGVPDIECIGSQLDQVFMNLLVNAAHAIETRGTITIRTGATEADVWVEVADTGKGIPPEHLQRIFEPFFTTKPFGQGTGLGLSVVHRIVLRHHGTIQVESAVGHGTTFRVTIPRQRAADDVKPDAVDKTDEIVQSPCLANP